MDFWQIHGTEMGILFLLGAAIFPRITMLFAVATPFGWLAWLGWAIAPHITVAVLATQMYWHTNRILCIFAWLFAILGTGSEGGTARRYSSRESA
jgi:hypothetical protein